MKFRGRLQGVALPGVGQGVLVLCRRRFTSFDLSWQLDNGSSSTRRKLVNGVAYFTRARRSEVKGLCGGVIKAFGAK